MNIARNRASRAACALVILGAAMGCTAALAADKTDKTAAAGAATARTADQQDRPVCGDGRTPKGATKCRSQADFDIARSRQAALDKDPAQYLRNAQERCKRLAAEDRRDCEARIAGKGSTSGSIAGGGIYRELVTIEIGAPASAASAVPAR